MTSLGVPSGPPGPRPADTRPPTKPPTPTPPQPPKPTAAVDEFLYEIDERLGDALARTALLRPPADRIEECGQAILEFRLQLARRAVADLLAYQSSTRQHLDSAAAVADGPEEAARSRADRAGEPPLPGTGTFSLPRTPPFDIGAGAGRPLYDVLPGRSS